MVKQTSYDVREIGAHERLSFWIAHGITPDAQLELEKYYDEYKLDVGEVEEVSGVQIQNTTYIEYPSDKS